MREENSAEVLDLAADLVAKGFAKEACCRNMKGLALHESIHEHKLDPRAKSWSTLGAISDACLRLGSPESISDARQLLGTTIIWPIGDGSKPGRFYIDMYDTMQWNDAHERTQDDVVETLRRAASRRRDTRRINKEREERQEGGNLDDLWVEFLIWRAERRKKNEK